MKIRLTEPGYGQYNGEYCGVPFKDGVSLREVLPIEANRIGAFIRAVTVETTAEGTMERCTGAGQELLDASNKAMPKVNTPLGADETAETGGAAEAPKLVAPEKFYTMEELANVADANGVQGLREIAEFYPDVKGRSVNELIERILRAQSELQAALAEQNAE